MTVRRRTIDENGRRHPFASRDCCQIASQLSVDVQLVHSLAPLFTCDVGGTSAMVERFLFLLVNALSSQE